MTALYFASKSQECVREVDDHTAECDVGRDVVLVRIGADDECAVCLAHCLENTESGSVGILEDDVGSTGKLCECLLLAGADVIPVADVGDEDLHLRIGSFRTMRECRETFLHRGQLRTAYHSDEIGMRHHTGDHSSEI